MNSFFNHVSVVPNQPLTGLADFTRRVAAEGVVVLKNDRSLLPLVHRKIAIFGRIQTDYYKSGTGSGGLVNVAHVTSILEGLQTNPLVEVNQDVVQLYRDWIKENPYNAGNGQWASEPWSQVEMPLTSEQVKMARQKSDVAVIIIGRTAGEDKDNFDGPGSYRLSELEDNMIKVVTSHFNDVVVILNVGAVIDMRFMDAYPVTSVVYGWHGGMEGGRAVSDVITGLVPASGKLSSTIAYEISDNPSHSNFGGREKIFYQEDIYVGYRYFTTFAPEKVRFPFGFGLTYTTFSLTQPTFKFGTKAIDASIVVTNTGNREGKQVAQWYVQAPQGVLGKPVRQLIAFAKTCLLQPGESVTVTVSIPWSRLASYDDGGLTGHRSCFVLEAGDYHFACGTDALSSPIVASHTLSHLVITEKLLEAAAPVQPFKRMKPHFTNGRFDVHYEDTPLRQVNLMERIAAKRPTHSYQHGALALSDVYEGKVTLDQFIDTLSDTELVTLSRGEGMSSPKVTPGTAAAYGGVTEELIAKGIPLACASDGPSGIRMDSGQIASSLPNGIAVACTFNTPLIEELYYLDGQELRAYRIDTLLGPGMNIHRHPLNGRNFEYFSEDPLLTGLMGSAVTKGLQRAGVTGTLKHMACNNQETARFDADSIVSERALREIYLRGFEIAVKEGHSRAIMTSYNPINGIWAASNFDINTIIVREQWGFDGLIVTDWWAKMNNDGDIGTRENTHAMVRSQNDIYMVVSNAFANSSNDNTASSLSQGVITRGELHRNTHNILRFLMQTPAFFRLHNLALPAPILPNSPWIRTSQVISSYPTLQSITINGKPLKEFNPLVTWYEVDGKEDELLTVKAVGTGTITILPAIKTCNVTMIKVTENGQSTVYYVAVVNKVQREAAAKVLDTTRLRARGVPTIPNQAWASADFRLDNPLERSPEIEFKHLGTETIISNCMKGTSLTYGVDLAAEGKYIVELVVRSNESRMAQLPFSILVDGEIKSTLTATGTDNQWISVNSHMRIPAGVHYISFLYNRTGLEFKQIKVVKHG